MSYFCLRWSHGLPRECPRYLKMPKPFFVTHLVALSSVCHCLVHLWVAKGCPKGGMMLPRPLSVTDNGRRRRRCCQTGLIKTRRAFKKYRHIIFRPKIARGVHFRSQLVFISKSSCFQMQLKLSTSLKAKHLVTISSSVLQWVRDPGARGPGVLRISETKVSKVIAKNM